MHALNRQKAKVMEHIAEGAQPPADQQRSTGELVRSLSEQVSVLVRDELRLAQLELTRKGRQAGSGAGLLGASGLLACYGVACLLACVIIALSAAVAAWLAALIVGAALLVLAVAGALAGKGRLREAAPPVPTESAGSVRTDIETIKERARR
jgi:uncharacterized membrane protein YqjE